MEGKCIFTHQSNKLLNKKGISLIEVIVSVALMAIIIGPFLGTIILSTRNNTYSEQVLNASELAQNVMEEIKSMPEFLEEKAVYEGDAQTTEYIEYLEEQGYRVRYKIVKREGTVSSLSDTYEFKDINDISERHLDFYVDSGSVELNGISYSLDSVKYDLTFSEVSGVFRYELYSNDIYVQSADIMPIEETEPIKININYLNDCEDIFKLNVNVDNISEESQVVFYIIDDKKDALEIYNTGTRPFYQFDEVTYDYYEYYNVLYEIELIVDYKGEVLNTVVSYVKKNR